MTDLCAPMINDVPIIALPLPRAVNSAVAEGVAGPVVALRDTLSLREGLAEIARLAS